MKKSTQKNKGLKLHQSKLSVLYDNLSVISDRLKRSDHFYSRLKAEGIELSPNEYFSRLRDKKNEIINSIGEITNDSAFSINPNKFIGFNYEEDYYLDHYFPYSITREEFMRRNDPSRISEEESCPSLNGSTNINRAEDVTINELTSINNNSTFSFETEDYLNDYGVVLFRAELNDKSSFWRNDNPDRIAFAHEMIWTLPAPECDSLVTCEILAVQILKFTNGADDGASIQTRVMLVPTDEQGQFLDSIDISEGTIFLDSKKSISDFYMRKRLEITFPVDAGSIPSVALLNTIQLSAQDGIASVFGKFQTKNLASRSHLLKYRIVPIST